MSTRKRVPKAKTERNHAIARMSSRFGVNMNRVQYNAMVKSIQDGKAVFLDRQSNRVSRFIVRLGDKEMVAVYDRNRKTIVTFLTMEMVEKETSCPEKA